MDLSEAIKIKDPAHVTRHPWETTRLKIIAFLLSKQRNKPFFHLLDVGSGDAFVLQHLLQSNAALTFSAVDPAFSQSDIEKISAVPNSGNIHLYKELHEINPAHRPVDCILLLDVLEHVADDKKLITDIFQHIDGTKITKWLITVPAFQSLFSHHDVQLKHYRRYNLKQLRALCAGCGLKINRSGYFFFSLLPLRIIQKMLLQFSKKEHITTIENWHGGAILTSIIETALWIDFRISFLLSSIGINIPGLSCYCICY